MKLPEWLKIQNWTNLQLASALGVSEECARLYRAGLRRPGPVTTQRILTLTAGTVTPADLAALYDLKQKQGNKRRE